MTTTDWGGIYKELGARPVINATGSVTMLGGSTPAPEVREAMDRADGAYVPLMELEERAGEAIEDGGCPSSVHHFRSWFGSDPGHRCLHGR